MISTQTEGNPNPLQSCSTNLEIAEPLLSPRNPGGVSSGALSCLNLLGRSVYPGDGLRPLLLFRLELLNDGRFGMAPDSLFCCRRACAAAVAEVDATSAAKVTTESFTTSENDRSLAFILLEILCLCSLLKYGQSGLPD